MGSNRNWQADAEDRIARREETVADRLYGLAGQLPDTEATLARADLLSVQAVRHRARARRPRVGPLSSAGVRSTGEAGVGTEPDADRDRPDPPRAAPG